MFYLYSIVYFFLIYRPGNRAYAFVGQLFIFVNVVTMCVSGWGAYTTMGAACTEHVYGVYVMAIGALGVFSCICVLILALIFFIFYMANGHLPCFIANTQVEPYSSARSPSKLE